MFRAIHLSTIWAAFGVAKARSRNAKTRKKRDRTWLYYADVIRLWGKVVGWSGSQLAWPAPLGENDTSLVSGAAQCTRDFKGFVAFGTRRHLTRNFQRVLGSLVPIQSIPIR
jgi:hypothetical protein